MYIYNPRRLRNKFIGSSDTWQATGKAKLHNETQSYKKRAHKKHKSVFTL